MDAIAEIYAALDSEAAFARVPEILATAAGARSAILQVFDRNWEIQGVHLNYFTDEMVARYINDDLWRLDPWKAPAVQALNRFISMDESVPAQRLVHSTFFNENFRYWGDDTAHCLAGAYDLPDGGFFGIGVHRGLGSKDFSDEELAGARALTPHILRLFELRARLRAADAQAALSEAALNAQADAVFVVDSRGRPQLMNAQAEALVGRRDGLSLSRVGLRADRDAEARQLAEAIESACARRGGQGGALPLTRRGGRALRAVVSPLSVGDRTLALVVVNDPARADPGVIEALKGLYGLTRAEAETAAALSRGVAPVEIAETRGVSLATTRTQIRQILQKTEARGLSDLAAVVATVPPGFRGE